jgi:hypothetical protein
MQLIIQNNSTHAIRVGDSPSVSATVGLLIQPGGSSAAGTFTSGATYLNNWYIAGTSGDVIDYQYTQED